MNNNFNIHEYFVHNFNLGEKPSVSKYKPKPVHIIILLVSVALLFVKFIAGLVCVAVFGFAFVGLPFMKISKEKKAADEWQKNYDYREANWHTEYDKFYERRVAKLNPKASGIKRLGLDLNPDTVNEDDRTPEELEKYPTKPFYIYGSTYPTWYRKRDGVMRTNDREITYFFFSKDQIYLYKVSFKLTEEDRKKEETQEFFYSDITSVSVVTESYDLDEKSGSCDDNSTFIETERFKLVVPGDKMSFAFTANEWVDASVNGMKHLIRTKKNG